MYPENKYKLLLLEDSKEDAELVSRLVLKNDRCEIKWVKNKSEFFEEVKTFAPDIILSDYNMDSFNALEAIMIAKVMRPDVPIIVISGTVGEDVAVETIMKGADDYLMKDRLARLGSAISRALQKSKDRLECKKKDEKIASQAREWQTTFDSIASCIFLMNPESMILQCNKAAEKFLDKTKDEIIGHHCWEVIHGTQCPIPECPVYKIKKAQKRAIQVLKVGDKFLQVTVDPVFDDEDRMTGIVHIIDDITESKLIEQQLNDNVVKLEAAQDLAKIGFWNLNLSDMSIIWSKGIRTILELPSDSPQPTYKEFWQYIFPTDKERVKEMINKQLKPMTEDTTSYDYRIVVGKNKIKYLSHIGYQVLSHDGRVVELFGSIQDITERKQAELYKSLSENIIKLLNKSDNFQDTTLRIAEILREIIPCDAVGIRLRSNDDFPYFVQNGFPPKFLLTENTLVVRDSDGNICREIDGTAKLECMCRNVLQGRTNPDLPFFTKGGSFWTNSTTKLLSTTTDKDRQAATRNRCNKEGYESVALIPIRVNDEILGLLQVNGHSENNFNLTLVETLEGIAKHIGNAIMNKMLKEEINKAEKRFMDVLYASKDAILLIDKKNIFIECNNAVVEMLGYKSKNEFLMTHPSKLSPELQPDGRKSVEKADDMIKLALDKGYNRFEWIHTKANGEDFPVEVSLTPIFSHDKVLIHCIWRDISEVKKAEKELSKKIHDLEVFNKAAVEREIKMIELKKMVKKLEKEVSSS